jgi:hypothetical protein
MDSDGGMMLEERLEIGTKVYYVKEDNNAFRRKKIYVKDENGVEWFRYDKPIRTQEMTEHTIVGRVLKTVEGRVPSMEDHIDEYYLEDGNQIDEGFINEADHFNGYFLDKEEALKWIEDKKEEMHRIEHS